MRFPIILLDNGHGIDTKGKCSPDRTLLEWKFAREIAEQLEATLKARGHDVFRIVKENEDIPLRDRVRRVNAYCDQYGAKNCVLISIHGNASGSGAWMKAKGWECWTTKGYTRSDDLARCLYDVAGVVFKDRKIRKFNGDNDPDFENNWTIIYGAKCPAVLTENFFYDNADDLAYMTSEEGRKAIVKVHTLGIESWIAKHWGR